MKSGYHRFVFVSLTAICFLAFSGLDLESALGQFLTGPGGAPPTPLGATSGGLPDPNGGLITDIKTPQMSAGQSISIPIDVHNSSGFALPNWAGVLVEVHLADPSEVDIVAVKVGGVPQPHSFPLSGATPGGGPAPGSTAEIFPVFHPAAFGSGITLNPSSAFPAITLDLVAKNTNPINNSDIDINLKFADIYHQPNSTFVYTRINTATTTIHLASSPGSTSIPVPTPGSTTWQWANSHRVLVPSSINDLEGLHLTAGGHQANSNNPFPNANPSQNDFQSAYVIPRNVDPATGHFIHFPAGVVHRVASSTLVHNVGRLGSTVILKSSTWASTFTAFIPGSQIIAVPFLATASIGIEHVPEPAAPILLLCGLASLGLGFRARRQRRLLA